ncbi:MAG: methylenetetrahydrofolate reductase [NAD(P)H] [Betaproteobacteria bacterium TMED156]|nr:MAG: methylenetetrahydrofolate reductase [NAD(P)H] [Betaproteobacteria bacterium TMED156]|tara:strand:+ start:563 stop:1390 length:828 start_codon:yes stop_codon:yes gene_type:complete
MEISIEFFPPKSEEGFARLDAAANELSKLNISYASVTYGAGGSTQNGTLSSVEMLSKVFKKAVPHISCIGADKDNIINILENYKQLEFDHLIVLRGDLPSGFGRGGEFSNAVDLVKFIREKFQDYFRIDVAAYPEIHPQAASPSHDIKYFSDKIKAGANGAITQYFFNADAYFKFVDDAYKLGVDVPIIPGIMPITNFIQLARFSDNCGAEIPRWIRQRLNSYGDDSKSIFSFGIDVITDLCDQLISAGTPGLHFYSMNKSKAIRKISKNLSCFK